VHNFCQLKEKRKSAIIAIVCFFFVPHPSSLSLFSQLQTSVGFSLPHQQVPKRPIILLLVSQSLRGRGSFHRSISPNSRTQDWLNCSADCECITRVTAHRFTIQTFRCCCTAGFDFLFIVLVSFPYEMSNRFLYCLYQHLNETAAWVRLTLAATWYDTGSIILLFPSLRLTLLFGRCRDLMRCGIESNLLWWRASRVRQWKYNWIDPWIGFLARWKAFQSPHQTYVHLLTKVHVRCGAVQCWPLRRKDFYRKIIKQ